MKQIVTVFFLGFIVACSATRVATVRDPDAPRQRYETVLVNFELDYQNRVQAEDEFIRRLTKGSPAQTVRASALFPPTREFTAAQRQQKIKGAGIQAELRVRLAQTNTERVERAVPIRMLSPSRSRVWYSDPWSYPVYATEAYPVTYWTFDAHLIDLKTGRAVWYAAIKTVGGEPQAVALAAKAAAKEVLASGFLPLKSPSASSSRRLEDT